MESHPPPSELYSIHPSYDLLLPECLACYPGGIYLFKVNIRNTRARSELFSKLTIQKHQNVVMVFLSLALNIWCLSGIFIVNFEHVSHLFLVFLLLTLNK